MKWKALAGGILIAAAAFFSEAKAQTSIQVSISTGRPRPVYYAPAPVYYQPVYYPVRRSYRVREVYYREPVYYKSRGKGHYKHAYYRGHGRKAKYRR